MSQPTQKLKQQYSIYTDARVDIDKHSVFCSLLFSIYSIYIHIQITHVWIFINLDHPTLHHPTNPTKYGLLEQVLRPHHFRPHQNRLTRAPKKTPHWTALAQSPWSGVDSLTAEKLEQSIHEGIQNMYVYIYNVMPILACTYVYTCVCICCICKPAPRLRAPKNSPSYPSVNEHRSCRS